ncbi:MAG: nicotinate (nicotinamide) nucleotide adenylyltransferase [Microgenomates group bacterium]|nr:nicotinate (nicotinamide) nucleotide adenylyltransferase [Microgenomates group bacterium]
MKIAILGGSFNPPHFGHLLVAEQIIGFNGIEEVWLMPCFIHPLGKKLAPAKDRLKMVKMLENKNIKVSLFEIRRRKISYTIDTLETISKKYSQHHFYWIIGSEQIKEFKKWRNYQELVKKYNFIVFPRDIIKPKEIIDELKKFFGKKAYTNFLPFFNQKMIVSNISSSMIRERIKKGQEIKYFVPEKVEFYIKKKKLYQ